MALECEHGQLARACNICEYEREIAELKAEIKEKCKEIAKLKYKLFECKVIINHQRVGRTAY